MTMTFQPTQRVGEIVAAFPGASNLFKAAGIDFCCGGGKSLSDALRVRGIAEDAFLAALEAAYAAEAERASTDVDWREAPLGGLIGRIVNVHHGYLRQELPLLSGFTQKIHRVHGEGHPELAQLDRLFHALKAELEEHLAAEEAELFPLVRAYAESGAREDLSEAIQALAEFESEHEAAGKLLAEMRQVTDGYTLPPGACRTYTLTFHKLQELESDLFMHIHLENNILFARLREAAARR